MNLLPDTTTESSYIPLARRLEWRRYHAEMLINRTQYCWPVGGAWPYGDVIPLPASTTPPVALLGAGDMTQESYQDFLNSKRLYVKPTGPVIDRQWIHELLYHYQKDIVHWVVQKGRGAIFADTGLGKTYMQCMCAKLIAEYTGMPFLIFAPLSVAMQTIHDAKTLGIDVHYAKSQADVSDEGIYITNYEKAHKFVASHFGGVALDESSILKSLDSQTRLKLTVQWRHTSYKFCFTATPAPNDLKEIVNHADFLGVMTRKEVFATFFINEEGKNGLHTRLKHHAVKPFYEWMSSWAVAIKRPSDLGYSDEGFILPGLEIIPHIVRTDYRPADKLFFTSLKGVQDRAKVRAATMAERVEVAAALVNSSDEQWIVWHELNQEGYELTKLIEDSVLVEGKDSDDDKELAFERFIRGEVRVLVTKPSIAGFGMNFQNSHHMAFVGINDSWEDFYQCIRRQYRHKQKHEVKVHVIYADVQQDIYENILRKENQANDFTESLIREMKSYSQRELANIQRDEHYRTADTYGKNWRMMLGDSVERLKELPNESVHLSVFSPPFVNRYAYTATPRDLGNSSDMLQFMNHFHKIIAQLYRVLIPGRNVCCHCQQVRLTKRDTGEVQMVDFRGWLINAFTGAGFTYSSERTIDKDAQRQAQRKKHVGLKFQTLHTDSSKLDGALADYLLVFKKPGQNPYPIKSDVTEEEWIKWARPVWYDIKEIDVLDTQKARADDDEMHLCPLQLPFIERCVKLWSGPGEVVLSPFAGIGSEPYKAVELGRAGIGIELKPEYYQTAIANLTKLEDEIGQIDLFEWAAKNQAQEITA